MNVEEITRIVTPTDVAIKYLGNPIKIDSSGYWYKAPWRNERTASLVANNKNGIHDFGESWHGDIIDFVRRLFNLSFPKALKLLKQDFGITDNEYETEEVVAFYKEQQRIAKERREFIKNWFNKTYCKICDIYQQWAEIKEEHDGWIYDDAYVLAVNQVVKYEGLCEYMREVTDLEKLYEDRRSIECFITTH